MIVSIIYFQNLNQNISNFSFPGLLPKDDILLLLKLMASKNPTKDIAAKILLNGGYDPCKKFPPNATFWTNNIDCDAGFISDNLGGYCYMLLPDKENVDNGDKYCKNINDAELISFDRAIEVDGFLSLLSNGIKTIYKLIPILSLLFSNRF
jgi:hypothetical protein